MRTLRLGETSIRNTVSPAPLRPSTAFEAKTRSGVQSSPRPANWIRCSIESRRPEGVHCRARPARPCIIGESTRDCADSARRASRWSVTVGAPMRRFSVACDFSDFGPERAHQVSGNAAPMASAPMRTMGDTNDS